MNSKISNSIQYQSLLGVDPEFCDILWNYICEQFPLTKLRPKYLLSQEYHIWKIRAKNVLFGPHIIPDTVF